MEFNLAEGIMYESATKRKSAPGTGSSTCVFHRYPRTQLPVAARGEGAYIFDSEGRQYLDTSGGAAVSCLGHNHPQVIDAIKAQLDNIPFAHTAFFSNPAMEQGLICYPMAGTIDGKNGSHVLLAPPFILRDDQIGEIVDKLALAVDAAVASAVGGRA